MSGRFGGLMRGTLIYGVGQALGRSITLLLLPFLTAYLDPAAYGVLAVLTAFGLLLNMIFSVGLGAATAPAYFDGHRRAATIWTAFAILCISSAFMIGLTILFAQGLARIMLGDEQFRGMVLLAAGATAFSILSLPFRQFLMFEERPVLYVMLSTASLVAALVFTVWFVAGLGRGIRGVLEAELLAQLITCLMFAAPVLYSSTIEIRSQLGRELLGLGIPLIPAFASVFVLQHGSRYILQWLRGPDQVGVYAVGVNLASALGLLVAGFQSAWMPYFMRYAERRDEAREVFGRVALYYTFAVGGASLLFYLFARPAVALLSGPEYRGAADIVGMAATAQFLSGLFLVLIPGLYFAREVQYVGAVQAIAATAAMALNLVLVPLFGYVGSAAAVLTSYLLLNVGQLWWNRRRAYLDVDYDWRRLRRFATLYGCTAIISFAPRELPIAVEGLLAMAAAAALGLALWGLLTPSERGVVRLMVTRRAVAVGADAPVEIGPRI